MKQTKRSISKELKGSSFRNWQIPPFPTGPGTHEWAHWGSDTYRWERILKLKRNFVGFFVGVFSNPNSVTRYLNQVHKSHTCYVFVAHFLMRFFKVHFCRQFGISVMPNKSLEMFNEWNFKKREQTHRASPSVSQQSGLLRNDGRCVRGFFPLPGVCCWVVFSRDFATPIAMAQRLSERYVEFGP